MKNQPSMNVMAVARYLKLLGCPVKKVIPTDDVDVEDDSIEVTDTISVQVSSIGDAWISVSRTKGDDFIFYPERLDVRDVWKDIQDAMEDERKGL